MSNPVIIETAPNPDAAVILFHGLGADGHDFEPIVAEMNLPEHAAIRFIFPHAPTRPVTLNGGMAMPAWYDILGIDRSATQDEAGIRQSSDAMLALAQGQVDAGIAPERVVLAGFSQGGAVALFSALRTKMPIAGVLALSTYLPLHDVVADEHNNTSDLPIFMAHGEQDPVLPIALATDSKVFMESLGYQVQWLTYPMPHSVCLEEINAMRAWLLSRLEIR
ncbi:MAG: alpha/beta hydrolase [Woeseiaceae bacterium]